MEIFRLRGEEGRCEICDSRIEKEEYGLIIEIDVNIDMEVNIEVGVDIEVEGDSYLNIDK